MRDFCSYRSQVANLHRGGDLRLTTWRLLLNAKIAINGVCGQKGVKHLKFKGYDNACGFPVTSGLCIDTATGQDCQFDVQIAFRRWP